MICVFCSHETSVTNSRPGRSFPLVWRRRSCSDCVVQFTTQELPDFGTIFRVTMQRPKETMPFQRDKLFISIHRALLHRPDALESAIGITTTVLRHMLKAHQKTHGESPVRLIDHRLIARYAVTALKRYDPLAAATYKAYHQDALKKS